MSIGSTVKRFANETVPVRRFDGFYDSGRWEKRLAESFEIKANVQPAGAADLERLPENYRRQGGFWIWPRTNVELRTGEAARSANEPGVMADEVTIKGVQYEVGAVDGWRRHTRYLVARASQ